MRHLDTNEIWDYIGGDLNSNDLAYTELHLKKCSKCKHNYTVQLELHNELYNLEDDLPSPEFSKNIIRKIEHNLQIERVNRFWIKFTKYAILSALFIAISLSLLLITIQEIEFTIDKNYLNKSFRILLSAAIILWMFYAFDRLLKQVTKNLNQKHSNSI